MRMLDGGRDIDVATTLLVDALTCLKRANAAAAADHVLDALRQIEEDFGVVSLQSEAAAGGGS